MKARKLIVIVLALVMACSVLPMTASAANGYGPLYFDHGGDLGGDMGFWFEDCIYFDAAVMEPVEVYDYAYKITMKPGSTMNIFYGDSFDDEFMADIQEYGGAFGFFCYTKTDDISELYPWEFAEVNGEYFVQLSYDDYGDYYYIADKFSISTEMFAGEVDMILFYSGDITYYVMPEESEPEPITALVSPQKFEMDGERIDIGIYNIGDKNYFKLRDIAALVNGSGKQFSIGWDGELGVATLTSGEAYKVLDTDLQPGGGVNKQATESTATVVLNGEVVKLAAYNIDGYTYYQLRDLCKALDIKVTWDSATGTIGIDPTQGYN